LHLCFFSIFYLSLNKRVYIVRNNTNFTRTVINFPIVELAHFPRSLCYVLFFKGKSVLCIVSI
jgi:hypothetical protein